MDVFSSTRQPDQVPDVPISSRYTPSYLTYLLAGLVLISVITRVFSSRNSHPKPAGQDGAQTVPAVPYWMPLLGHLPNMAWDADGFVKSLRSYYTNGIFALNFGGTKHNIICTPGLATAFLNQKPSNADFEQIGMRAMTHVFGFPRKEMPVFEKAYAELTAQYKHLLTEPSLGEMVRRTTTKMKENILNLVSFATSPVDQMLWERTSSVQPLTDSNGEQVVEASLLPLIRDFCAHTANPSIMGSNFLAKFPDFFDDLWTLDRGFLLLAAGMPGWLPVPILTRARIARKRIADQICVFHEAMEAEASGQDSGPDWRDLDDVSKLVKERTAVYRKYGLSIRARAACEEVLMWAANANSNALVFWMINRIYSDPELLASIREEIAPYAQAVQPKQEFPIPEPPRLEAFNLEGLCSSCPLLKSCYVECLRLDTASWSLKVVKQDFVLQSREKDSPGWLLRRGEYAHAAHDLHNTDSNYFEDPMIWKADRHIRYEEGEKKATVDLGSIRPYGR